MADTSFEERAAQLERALKVINTIEDNPELQQAAFSWLMGSTTTTPASARSSEPATGGGETTPKPKSGTTKRTTKGAAVSQDKTLEIAPKGKQAWAAFVDEKKPTNQNEKNTAAVYWLLEVSGLPKATISQVVTLFLAAKWNLPGDPKNSAQVAGSAGYLNTADADDIKLTSPGVALIVNDLPRVAKPK